MSNIFEHLELGTFSFRNKNFYEIEKIIDEFYGLGGRYIDTAHFYGGDKFERFYGILSRKYTDLNFSSKIGYFKYKNDFLNPEKIYDKAMSTIENFNYSLHVLRIHDADQIWWWNNEDYASINDSPVVRIFDSIGNQYKINIGISGNNAKKISEILTQKEYHYIMIAKQYDLLWRNTKFYLEDYIKSSNSELVLAAPFHQGKVFQLNELCNYMGTNIHKNNISILKKIINETGLDVQSLTIKFLLYDKFFSRISFGVDSIENFNYLKKLCDINIDDATYHKIFQNGFIFNAIKGLDYSPK